MNFSEFYKDAQRELTSTFISMFAKGRPEYAEHLRWIFNNEEKEKLVQKPVFQSVFPWRTYPRPMSELTDLLGQDFINALDSATFQEPNDRNARVEDMSFSRDLFPYQHQVESWEAVLNDHKSIVVTTGTGSGKTECFMVPVLKDLLEERRRFNGNNPGVQAIFLYPLNALIASQRKRIHAWCSALNPMLTYGIYIGETNEEENADPRRNAFPQIIDRRTLRETPPQILFTNPTMLEYMMVRGRDQELVNNSRNLKWIILDEAHTYNGSNATEMAMMIRRVLQLFGKEPAEVNFAITSATIGEGREEEMNAFISNLTGKNAKEEFRFINGDRIIPELDENNSLDEINGRFNLNVNIQTIIELRQKLNSNPALSLNDICNELGFNGNVEERLKLIDELSRTGSAFVGGRESALLPVRAHFFGRSINGLYACTNPECEQYHRNHISIGTLTSFESQTCPHCGGKMLEVVRCGSCGEFLLQGERVGQDPIEANYRMKDNTIHFQHLLNDDENFLNDDDAEDDDDDITDGNNAAANQNAETVNPLLLSSAKDDVPFEGSQIYHYSLDSVHGIITMGDNPRYSSCNNPNRAPNDLLCPECGDKSYKCRKIVFPSSLESRLLAHAVLKQSPPFTNAPNPNECIYEGRKFITFTDSRQKTANITQGTNIAVEREWTRSMILYDLIEREQNHRNDEDRIRAQIATLEQVIQDSPQFADNILQMINEYREQLNNRPSSCWESFRDYCLPSQDLERLRNLLGRNNITMELYLKALFIDQMGNKPLRGNSLETLGLVHLDYPAINNLGINQVPQTFRNFFHYDDAEEAMQDWKKFLRICVDYQIRRNMHLLIPDDRELRRLVTQTYFSDPVYAPQINRIARENGITCKRWPQIRNYRQNREFGRLPLLLLLGNGICNLGDLNNNIVDSVNNILREAWDFISRNILTNIDENLTDGGIIYPGYKLNIFDSGRVKLSLIEEATVCPMTSQILDCNFRGISPMVRGHLDPRTLRKFTITAPTVTVPNLTIRRNDHFVDGGFDSNAWSNAVEEWFDNVFSPAMQPLGGDLSSQRQLFMRRPIFITVEHSAQIKPATLRESERMFERGRVNVLSCSTTMEMGVDIGGISVVLMNNVPPKPANYLQRTGRAGRRAETQSLAFTICGDNPIGRSALDDPGWALEHDIESPSMSFSSVTILQRHINSFLLGEYIRSTNGGSVTDQMGAFIFGNDYQNRNQNQNTINYTYEGFIDFLDNVRNLNNVLDRINIIVRGTAYETESFERMISRCKDMITSICDKLRATINSLDEERQHAQIDKYKKRLELRIKSLWTQNLLTYLSGHNFLPSNSIPTNIVELFTFKNRRDNEEVEAVKTSRPLSLAIQEYAPGREIVVGNLVYPVLGIDIKGNAVANEMIEKKISKCPACGCIYLGNIEIAQCPKCQTNLMPILAGQNGRSTLSVEPSGFIAGEYRRTKKPKLANDFIVPELIGMESWQEEEDEDIETVYRIRSSVHADARIIYVNKGKGYGFALCEYCGKMEPEAGLANLHVPCPIDNHNDISKGGDCYSNNIQGVPKRNILLSACYSTDISEMEITSDYDRYSSEYKCLLYTLGTVISNTFTQILGIDSDEVWFGITQNQTLFFYDTAAGGAGYANQLPIYIEKVLDLSRNKLKECNCEIACTNCLIDRKSQWFIEKLNKQLAIEWLERENGCRQVIPQELYELMHSQNILKVTRNISSEIEGKIRKKDFQSINYFLTEGLMSDEVLTMIEPDLKMTNLAVAPVTMVVSYADAHNNNLPIGTRMDLNSFAYYYTDLRAVSAVPEGITPIAGFTYGESSVLYVKYGSSIYLVQNTDAVQLLDYEVVLQTEPTDVCFVYNFRDDSVRSSDLLTTLLGNRQQTLHNFLAGKNTNVYVKYSDIYVSNPITCLVLGQVLRKFHELFGLEFREVEVNTGHKFKDPDLNPRFLDSDFMNTNERDEYLEQSLADNIGDVNVTINSNQRLAHARLLTIYNNEFEITINPDGGFAQGWKVYGESYATLENNKSRAITLTNTLFRNNLPIRFTIGWSER